ncbi:hypothetical protein ARMSODRAFT_1022344 [Armillaria solidipes]|uniref:Uncharacterized protein n=1 Tax=Armillaria solidipes TaxID=1076256 RepID=A0A2H3B3R3_9AGAR|nr:hypothetical protein ARMSODRAFT_1022344 [Armillaria solidipes]
MIIAGKPVPQELVDHFVALACFDDLSTCLHSALVSKDFFRPARQVAFKEVFVDFDAAENHEGGRTEEGTRVWHPIDSAIVFFSDPGHGDVRDLPRKLSIRSLGHAHRGEGEEPGAGNDADLGKAAKILRLLSRVATIRFRDCCFTTVAPSSSLALFNVEVRHLYWYNSVTTSAGIFGLLQAFPCIEKLALVGSRCEVSGGEDDVGVNEEGIVVDLPISTASTFGTVRSLKVLAVHFHALRDEDVDTLSRWLSATLYLEALFVKAINDVDVEATQRLVDRNARTLRKARVYVYEGRSWTTLLDLTTCRSLESLCVACVDHYGHVLVCTLLTLRAIPRRLDVMIHMQTWTYPNYHEQALKMFTGLANALLDVASIDEDSGSEMRVKVTVIHPGDFDWAVTKYKGGPDYCNRIESTCFQKVGEVLKGRFVTLERVGSQRPRIKLKYQQNGVRAFTVHQRNKKWKKDIAIPSPHQANATRPTLRDPPENKNAPSSISANLAVPRNEAFLAQLRAQRIDKTNIAKTLSDRLKLKMELKTHSDNMAEESILVRSIQLSTCQIPIAVKHHTKSREYCTTSQHVLDMCLSVLELLIEQGTCGHLHTHFFRAEAALDACNRGLLADKDTPTSIASVGSSENGSQNSNLATALLF